MGPTAFWLDSGIYLAAAKEMGIAYPPGFPLYVVLAHGFGSIPIGAFAQRVHALSALAGAGTCLVLYLIVARLAGSRPVALLTALGAGSGFALWSQAVNSEVYALQALLTMLMLHFLVRLEEDPRRHATGLSLAAGLGFANHPMVVGMIPALLAAAWRHRRSPVPWARAGAVFLLAGLVPYAYIPFRSRANPLSDWGDPETPGNFLRLVTASHWTTESSSFSLFGAGFQARALDAAVLFFHQFWPAALVLGVVGAVRLRRSAAPAFRYLLLTGLMALLMPLLYTQTKEFESWFIPAYLAFAAVAGAGAGVVLERARERSPRAGAPAVILLFALLYPGLVAWRSAVPVDRSGDWNAEDYGRNILHGADPNAILFISGDNPSSTVLFCQVVAGIRNDVKVVNQEALQSAWYRGYVRKNLGLNLPEPDPAPADPFLLVSEMVRTLIRENPSRPPCALMPGRLLLPANMRAVPAGMVFRLTARDEPPPAGRWDFTFHNPASLTGSPARDQREKVLEAVREMRAGYLRAYTAGAAYFLGRGDYSRAADLYAAAAGIAPRTEEAWLGRGVCLVQLGRFAEAREVFSEMVRLLPGSARGHYNLGNVLAELGEREAARMAYARALSIDPGFAMAQQALEGI